MMEAFAVFAGAFLMRPLGGMLFGVLGDRFRCVHMPAGCDALGSHTPYRPRWPPRTSRRSAVFVSLFMMALSTFSMGCLPTYDQVGITASMLLVFVRLVQGVSVGGQLVGTYVRLLVHHTIRATLTYATSLFPGTLFRLKAALRCEWVALQAVGPVPMPLRSRLRCLARRNVASSRRFAWVVRLLAQG